MELQALKDKLVEVEQKFNEFKAKHEQQLSVIETAKTQAKSHWDEMMRLQGDWRTLEELVADAEAKLNKDAAKIEAVAEEN